MGFRLSARRARGALAVLLIALVFYALALQAEPPAARGAAPAITASFPASATTAADNDIQPAGTLDLADLEEKFQAITRRVAPSVVAISASFNRPDSDDILRSEEMNADKLQSILDRSTRTVGTGFIIDSDGYILTNEHVIGEAEYFWVTTDDRKVYPAIVIGSDPRADLAVLKIPAAGLPAVRFADYNSARRGQWAIALGNPYGLATDGEMCMSVGIVSATDRSLPKLANKENRLYSNLIQTTAEINPGNSGGPLFDLNGRVIGVNTAVILPQKKTNGIGFALPITPGLMAKVRELKEGREVIYGYIGVTVTTATLRERRSAGINEEIGVRIDSVEENSPAIDSLRENDIVVRINGQVISDSDHFVGAVGATPVEQAAKFSIYRGGRAMTLDVTPRRRELPSVAISRQNQRLRWRGILLGPIPENWDFASAKKPESGLMVLGIESGSPLKKLGIMQGSIIIAVAGKPVATLADLQRIINDTPAEQCAVQFADSPAAIVSIE